MQQQENVIYQGDVTGQHQYATSTAISSGKIPETGGFEPVHGYGQQQQQFQPSHGVQPQSELKLPAPLQSRPIQPQMQAHAEIPMSQEAQLLLAAEKIRAAQDIQLALALQQANLGSYSQYAAELMHFNEEDLHPLLISIPDLNINLDKIFGRQGGIGALLQILNSPDFTRCAPASFPPAPTQHFQPPPGAFGSTSSMVQSQESMDTSSVSLNTSSKSLTDSQKTLYGVSSGVHWPIASRSSLSLTRY